MSLPDSFVFCSPFLWCGPWQSTHYFAHFASRSIPVLYVNPQPFWNPKVPGFSAAHLITAFGSRRPQAVDRDLYVFSPFVYPFGRNPTVRDRNNELFVRGIEQCCRRLGLQRPLYWMTYYEGCLEHARRLGGNGYVYFCLDHHERSDQEEERQLACGARLVFAVSPPLVAKHSPNNPRTFMLPNGVNLEWFSQQKLAGPGRPPDLPPTGPLIGFVGLLNRHLDMGLLCDVASSYPNACLALVGSLLSGQFGPTAAQSSFVNALKKMKNVRFLGFKQPWELPRYIAAFDVCLLPFQRTEKIWHSDPLKIYQYFALGKPVVSFVWPALDNYRSLFYSAASREAFVAQIGRALDEPPGGEISEARISLARTRNWPDLVALASREIEETFAN